MCYSLFYLISDSSAYYTAIMIWATNHHRKLWITECELMVRFSVVTSQQAVIGFDSSSYSGLWTCACMCYAVFTPLSPLLSPIMLSVLFLLCSPVDYSVLCSFILVKHVPTALPQANTQVLKLHFLKIINLE